MTDRLNTLEGQYEHLARAAASGLHVIVHHPGNDELWVGRDVDRASVFARMPQGASETDSVEILKGLELHHEARTIAGVSATWLVLAFDWSERVDFLPFASRFLEECDKVPAPQALSQTLAFYKRFWSSKRPLDAKEERGLVGELHVLGCLARQTAPDQVEALLDAWAACEDDDGLHDLVGGDLHLEVKTIAREPVVIQVSEVEQLTPLEDGRLVVAVVTLEAHPSGATLPEVAEATGGEIPEAAQAYFWKRLRKRGFGRSEGAYYHSRHAVGPVWLYAIEEGAPVFPASLLGEVPASVSRIRYSLAMAAIPRVAATVAHWKAFTIALTSGGVR